MPFGRPVLSGRPNIAAGQRKRRVTIQQLTDSVGASGFPVETWTTLATEYMGRKDLRANEHDDANQTSAFAETKWDMPYRSDMDPDVVNVAKTRRLVYEGKTYDILTGSCIDWRKGIELTTLSKG